MNRYRSCARPVALWRERALPFAFFLDGAAMLLTPHEQESISRPIQRARNGGRITCKIRNGSREPLACPAACAPTGSRMLSLSMRE
jgi:hypothetical protein